MNIRTLTPMQKYRSTQSLAILVSHLHEFSSVPRMANAIVDLIYLFYFIHM